MKQKTLYFSGILLATVALLLFLAAFIIFLITTDNYTGLESYIYWLIYQTLLVIICTYQYRIAAFHIKTSIKMSLLFFVPLIGLGLFIGLGFGNLHINLTLFINYLCLFFLNGLIYIVAAHQRSKELHM